MRKSLFADMVKFFEEACEKLSLHSGLFSFYLVLLFLLPLLNCIPNGTEANVGVSQNLRWSSLWKKLMVSSFQLVVLDLLQLSYLFFPTLIFSKSSGILVYLTECSYNEIHDTWVFAEYLFWRIPQGGCFCCSKSLGQVLETSLL